MQGAGSLQEAGSLQKAIAGSPVIAGSKIHCSEQDSLQRALANLPGQYSEQGLLQRAARGAGAHGAASLHHLLEPTGSAGVCVSACAWVSVGMLRGRCTWTEVVLGGGG